MSANTVFVLMLSGDVAVCKQHETFIL